MILTLRGYKLNILAAVVLVTSTKRHGVILPLYYRRHFVSINTTYIHTYIHTTPFSHTTDILSSTPLTPFGIRLKSSLPNAF